MVSQMWCVHVSGQHVVVLTHSPSEQFELFKAEHADCDVSKVSASGRLVHAVSVRVSACAVIWYTYIFITLCPIPCRRRKRCVGSLCMELALVVIGCIFDNYFLLLTLDLLTA